MNNYGTGLATGLAISHLRVSQAKNESRRKTNIGKDQMIFIVNKPIVEVLRIVSNQLDSGYVKDGRVWQKETFDLLNIVLQGLMGLLFGGLLGFIADTVINFVSQKFEITFFYSFILGIIGVICGIIYGLKPYPVDYIKIKQLDKNKTRVLVKVYDSDGNRNLDDDELQDIIDSFN